MKPADLWEMLAAVPLHHWLEVEADGLTADDVELTHDGQGVAVLVAHLPEGWATTPAEPTDEMLAAGMKAGGVPLPPATLRAVWRAMHKAVNASPD